MSSKKSFLRHEILNIITLMNFLIADSNLKKNKKNQILKQSKLLSTLVAEEEVLLGKRKKFFNRSIDLDEVLTLVHELQRHELKEQKVTCHIQSINLVVNVDFEVLKNGLEQILLYLAQHSKSIQVSIKQSTSILLIEHMAEPVPLSKEPLLETLKKHGPHDSMILTIALKLMLMNGMKLKSIPGSIEVHFPKPSKIRS